MTCSSLTSGSRSSDNVLFLRREAGAVRAACPVRGSLTSCIGHRKTPASGGSGAMPSPAYGSNGPIPSGRSPSDAISHRVEFRVSMLDTPTMKDQSIGARGSPLDMGSIAQIRFLCRDDPCAIGRRPIVATWSPLAKLVARGQGAHAGAPLRDEPALILRWTWGPSLEFASPSDRTAESSTTEVTEDTRGNDYSWRRARITLLVFSVPSVVNLLPIRPLDMGSIARICPSRPTSAGMPGECRVASTGRPRPSSH